MWFGWLVFFLMGLYVGRRLFVLEETMLARRVARFIKQSEEFQRTQRYWDEVVSHDRSVRRSARNGQDVHHGEEGHEATQTRPEDSFEYPFESSGGNSMASLVRAVRRPGRGNLDG